MEKNCGNCGHGERRAISCSKRDGLFIARKPGCEHWKEATDTLEQRYAQLEQVALRMFQKLDVTTTRKDDELDGIEAELERLGVFDD